MALGPGFEHTCELLGLLGGHSSEVPQIALVTNQHDDNIVVGVVSQLLQPSRHVLVRLMLANVVDKQRADSAAVVGRGNGAIPFLTRSVPNLCLDRLGVNLDRSRGKLDTDGGLGVEVELVASESAEQVGLSDTGVADKHHWWEAMLANDANALPG